MTDYERVQALPDWQDAIEPFSPAFQRGILFVLAHENEYNKDGTVRTEHDPSDPGGTTKFGIDQASHPGLNIDGLFLCDAVKSYHSDEWFRARGDDLPEKLAIAHFDGVVNMGEEPSAQLLQEALGVPVDGHVGPKTIAAAIAAPETALASILAGREAYYRRLRKFPRYGKGWLARVADLRAYLA